MCVATLLNVSLWLLFVVHRAGRRRRLGRSGVQDLIMIQRKSKEWYCEEGKVLSVGGD